MLEDHYWKAIQKRRQEMLDGIPMLPAGTTLGYGSGEIGAHKRSEEVKTRRTTMQTDKQFKKTAYHEAGHHVAHYRLSPDRYRGNASIVPDHQKGTAGHVQHEEEWSPDPENLQAMVMVLCAGYAACATAGMDDAREGCNDDFEKAEKIITGWNLDPLEEYLKKAVDLMRRPKNRRAVHRLANELLEHGIVDGQYVEAIIYVADEGTAEAEAQLVRYRTLMWGQR